jgi:hypothetical protein
MSGIQYMKLFLSLLVNIFIFILYLTLPKSIMSRPPKNPPPSHIAVPVFPTVTANFLNKFLGRYNESKSALVKPNEQTFQQARFSSSNSLRLPPKVDRGLPQKVTAPVRKTYHQPIKRTIAKKARSAPSRPRASSRSHSSKPHTSRSRPSSSRKR